MTLEQSFRAAVLADATVSAYLVDRFYPVQLPPNPAYPCAAYQRISTPGQVYVHSPSTPQEQGRTNWSRIQVTIWAATAIVVEQIAQAIVATLQTFNLCDQPGSPDLASRAFPNFVMNERMGVEPQTQPPIFKYILDLKIWFRN